MKNKNLTQIIRDKLNDDLECALYFAMLNNSSSGIIVATDGKCYINISTETINTILGLSDKEGERCINKLLNLELIRKTSIMGNTYYSSILW